MLAALDRKILEVPDLLNDWEVQFISDMLAGKRRKATPKQLQCVIRLWKAACD